MAVVTVRKGEELAAVVEGVMLELEREQGIKWLELKST